MKRKREIDPPPALSQALYSIKDVKLLGGPCRDVVRRLINEGKIRTVEIGGRRYLDGDSVRALLREGAQ